MSYENLSRAIFEVLAEGPAYSIRERGKNLYQSGSIPRHLSAWLEEQNLTTTMAARRLGMSSQTLRSILAGAQISDSMLARMLAPASGILGAPTTWRDVRSRSVQGTILELSEKLIYLKDLIQRSNSIASGPEKLDAILVNQVVAMLETTLASIRAPYVEESRTRRFFKWLLGVGKKAVEQGLEKEIIDAMGDASDIGAEFLKEISDLPGISDLDKLL